LSSLVTLTLHEMSDLYTGGGGGGYSHIWASLDTNG